MNKLARIAAASFALVAACLSSAAAEDVLKAASGFPTTSVLGSDFQMFIQMVNERGKGVIRVEYMGGPEIMPASEQGTGLANGLIHLLHSAPVYFTGRFPEAEIFAAKARSSTDIRADGGVELFNEALKPRLGARLQAFSDGQYGQYILTVKEPPLNADGLPDLSGFELRGNTIYQPLFTALGAATQFLPPAEVYTALQRGMIDGLGYTLTDVEQAGWHDYLRYFVTPMMYGGSVAILSNNAAYDRLSPEARKILDEVSIEYEVKLEEIYKTREAEAREKLQKLGMKEIALQGDAAQKFRALAVKVYRDHLSTKTFNVDLDQAMKIFAGQ